MPVVCPSSGRRYPKLIGSRSLYCDDCRHTVPLEAGTVIRHDRETGQILRRGAYVPRPRLAGAVVAPRQMHGADGMERLRAARQETLTVFFENPHGAEWTARLTACIQAEHRVASSYGLL